LDEVMEEHPDDSLVTAVGPTIWLRLSPNFSVSGKELSWQFEGIGSGQIEGYEFMFGVPRDNLVKGLPYELQLPVSYGDIGEAGTATIWLIRLSGK
jgi:hypothetical protein